MEYREFLWGRAICHYSFHHGMVFIEVDCGEENPILSFFGHWRE